MIKEIITEIIVKLEQQRYDEAFVNLEGLIFYMHESLPQFTGDEILCVAFAHDALEEVLSDAHCMTGDSQAFNGAVEFCAHLTALRLREALGDPVSGRAAKAMSQCLEMVINKQKEGDQEK
jgi:hypothetical protein